MPEKRDNEPQNRRSCDGFGRDCEEDAECGGDSFAATVAAAAILWLIVAFFWHYSSLASISAAAALPIFMQVLYAPHHGAPPSFVTLGTVLISLLVLVKHRANIARLIAGTENRIKFRRG